MLDEAIKAFSDIKLEQVLDGPGGYKNVYVTFNTSNLSIADRGKRLMEVEDELINCVSPNIRVWHVPIGDKNSLRKLRGVNF